MKINRIDVTLTFIYGNESLHIERFLNNFGRYFSKFVAIRAIGNLEPDDTKEKIDRWENGQNFVLGNPVNVIFGEYKNDRANDWPHVDNFSKARNAAVNLAETEWIFWADCDDVPSDGFDKVFLAEYPDDVQSVAMLYDVRNGMHPYRERLVKNECAKWVNCVHEIIEVDKLKSVINTDVKVIHDPQGERKNNSERNIRLLKSELDVYPERNALTYFYLFQECITQGNLQMAVVYSNFALCEKDLPDIERYEILIQLANNESGKKRRKTLLEAVGVAPWRREAYGMLALGELESGNKEAANAYALACNVLPIPSVTPWTHRPAWYGWLGRRVLSMCSEPDKREAYLKDMFMKRNGKITILHATYKNPTAAMQVMNTWLHSADDAAGIDYVFAFNDDDELSCKSLSRMRHVKTKNHALPGGTSVQNWNTAAKEAWGDVFIVVADDLYPPCQGWDTVIKPALTLNDPAALYIGHNGCNDILQRHPVLNRKLYEANGYVFNPEYTGVFCDNDFTLRNAPYAIIRNDIKLDHRHNYNSESTQAINQSEAYKYNWQIFKKNWPQEAVKFIGSKTPGGYVLE